MYKCRSCNGSFGAFACLKEQSGEKWYVCPLCKSTDFVEIGKKNPLPLRKNDAIHTLITALCAINEADFHGTREILIEFICDIVGESPFIYKDSLFNVTESCKEGLIGELCAIASP